jgi:hypothetical protein
MSVLPPLALSLALILPWGGPAQAQSAGEAQARPQPGILAEEAPALRALFEAMNVYAVLEVVAAEGVAAAPEMEADMFPGQGGSAWPAVVASIYASDRLIEAFDAAVPVEAFDSATVARLTEFFESDTGQRIAAGELRARQAFLEPGVEEAAEERAAARAADGDPRMELLSDFIAANDLIERNVTGALNSNFAFYRGLSDGGAFETEIPEALMLSEVWGQEAELRRDSSEWLYAYQIVAYDDLTDAELQAYIDLSRTPDGQTLNAALFDAFDAVFNAVSYDLGVAAATFISGEET